MNEVLRNRQSFLIAGLVGVLALGGCARIGNTDTGGTHPRKVISEASVLDGSTFRTDPARMVNVDGGDNACLRDTPTELVLKNQIGYESDGIGDDANGPWIGLKLENLPSDFQAACEYDRDEIIWVVESQVRMEGSSAAG